MRRMSSATFVWTLIGVLPVVMVVALVLTVNAAWQLMADVRQVFIGDWLHLRIHWVLGMFSFAFGATILVVGWRVLAFVFRVRSRHKGKPDAKMPRNESGLHFEEDAPAKEDELGRGSFVEMLSAALEGTKADLDGSAYVALYGRWGEGKTTVCNMLRKKCRDSGLLFVDFNPWQGEGEGHLAEQLFDALARGVLKRSVSGAKLARQLRLFGVQLAGSWRIRRVAFSLPVETVVNKNTHCEQKIRTH